MAIIGFIVLVVIGIWFMFQALAGSLVCVGFSGKFPWVWFIFTFGIGSTALFFAVKNSPFHVTIS